MAGNDRRRQKKLERKSARRKEKKQTVARVESAGLPARIQSATHYPVLHSWIADSNAKDGIGWVLLSRAVPGGMVAFACFLVDCYCLGVKNLIVDVVHQQVYEERMVRKMLHEMPGRAVPPADVCKYVTEAVAYARELGFSPHADYSTAALLFADIDPATSTATFEYGKDGKPFFVAGPNESPERSRQILAILNHSRGQGNYHFMIPFARPDLLEQGGLPLIEEEDEAE